MFKMLFISGSYNEHSKEHLVITILMIRNINISFVILINNNVGPVAQSV